MKSPVIGSTDSPPVLYAEYARMLVTMHAVFIGVAYLLSAGPTTMTVVGISASVWVALRASRALTWHWCFPAVTLVLLCLLAAAVWQQGDRTTPASHGLFSCRVSIALLVLMSCVDLAEVTTRLHRLLSTADRIAWVRAGLMSYGLLFLKWGTIGLVLAYSILVPLVDEVVYVMSSSTSASNVELDRMSPLQNALFCFCEAMTGVWFFVIGCCVGSFLNVVIYRVPAGISVLAKSSHCPQCSEAIQSRDNLPLIGWLKLQGRCRNCGTGISSRYPLVELTTGLLFLLLYFVELISGGTNLPGRPSNTYVGVLWILFYTKWDLVGLYLFHCFVMCALLCWTMMQRDGNRVPTRSVVITLTIAAVAALIWPHLLPFTYDRNPRPYAGALTEWAILIAPLLKGAVAGLLAGAALRRLVGIPQNLSSWTLAGLALGWQSIAVVSLLCVAVKAVLLIIVMMRDTDSFSTATITDLPAESGEHSDTVVEPSVPTVTAAAYWWLFPTVLLVHHCLWRQLAFTL